MVEEHLAYVNRRMDDHRQMKPKDYLLSKMDLSDDELPAGVQDDPIGKMLVGMGVEDSLSASSRAKVPTQREPPFDLTEETKTRLKRKIDGELIEYGQKTIKVPQENPEVEQVEEIPSLVHETLPTLESATTAAIGYRDSMVIYFEQNPY